MSCFNTCNCLLLSLTMVQGLIEIRKSNSIFDNTYNRKYMGRAWYSDSVTPPTVWTCVSRAFTCYYLVLSFFSRPLQPLRTQNIPLYPSISTEPLNQVNKIKDTFNPQPCLPIYTTTYPRRSRHVNENKPDFDPWTELHLFRYSSSFFALSDPRGWRSWHDNSNIRVCEKTG